jgi:hypothetical protein
VIPSPTTPTCTRSSAPTTPAQSRFISNYLPLEAPYGGPNFFEFGPDVRYRINIDNDGDGDADIIYEFAFETAVANPSSFLYNSGPILSIDSANWNRKQFYSVTRISHGRREVLGAGLACPPCNIGPLSTPDYDMLASQAIHGLPGGRTVFAGQRAEGFYVDLGSIFDLGNLRPFENLHATFGLASLAAHDVVTVELRAIAGVTYPLVNSSYTPDVAAAAVTDGLTPASVNVPFRGSFPYLGTPQGGYQTAPLATV